MNESYTHAPHRRTGAEEQFSNAALLIDFDNVTMGTRSNLGQELRKLLNSDIIRGKVAVQRAYADWRRYPQYIVSLSESSIDLIFAPAYGSSKKNATDIRLAIDALELVFTRPEIGTYILLSGDSDFSSLVLKLKEYGKYVIGVGMQESSSDLLVQNCDEYYSYNSISGLKSAADGPTEKHDPWVLAGRTILKMKERKDVMRSDRFKQVMLELDPSFDEKEIGFSKFNRFLTEAASRGILSLEKAANGQYEVAEGSRARSVASGDGSSAPAPQSAGSGSASNREKRGRSRSRSRRTSDRASSRTEAPPAEGEAPEVDADRLRAAYDLLAAVTSELAGPDRPVRDSEVKRRMLDRDSKFDEGALGFRKFSRFLRQAHDEGVVDLERGPEGNYLLSPVGGATSAPAAGKAPKPERKPDAPPRDRGSERDRPERSSEAGVESKVEGERPVSGESSAVPRSSEPTKATPESEPKRALGMGRFRRGSRSRTSSAPSSSAPVPGPTDSSGPATGSSRSPTSEGRAGGSDAAADQEQAPRRSVSGRSRGRTRSGPDGGGRPETASSKGAASNRFRSEIETMSRNYPGVGRRTAEVLFGEFGESVYDVIDHEPERIRAVLPEHRARAVFAGREAERGATPNGD